MVVYYTQFNLYLYRWIYAKCQRAQDGLTYTRSLRMYLYKSHIPAYHVSWCV